MKSYQKIRSELLLCNLRIQPINSNLHAAKSVNNLRSQYSVILSNAISELVVHHKLTDNKLLRYCWWTVGKLLTSQHSFCGAVFHFYPECCLNGCP